MVGVHWRCSCWPVLLNVDKLGESSKAAASSSKHPDEEQVRLDTKRSFVVYPKGIPPGSKEIMQEQLYDVIVGVLRRYPKLSYFQGYHDIVSVLYLTYIRLPNRSRSRSSSRARRRDDNGDEEKTAEVNYGSDWETMRKCAEVLSVTRVRDAMSDSLEGMMGLLRILKRILRAADPDLSRFSSSISPVPTLPFFALSWILCLFSHDVDTLEPVQRMFDFLLARNPISAVYLAVAILIIKKPQMIQLAKKLGMEGQQDPTLLHPLFARLPPLYADTPESSGPPPPETEDDDPNPYTPMPLSEVFALTDDLVRRYPWDGKAVDGRSILGEGSVIFSWQSTAPLDEQVHLLDKEIVKPGAGSVDDDEEPPPPRLRLPRNKLGTGLAVAVLVVSVGFAVYNSRQLLPWAHWWAGVAQSWLGRVSTSWNLGQMYRRIVYG